MTKNIKDGIVIAALMCCPVILSLYLPPAGFLLIACWLGWHIFTEVINERGE